MNNAVLALQGTSGVTFSIVWAWIGAGFFAVAVCAFLLMGLQATPMSRGHFASKTFVVLVAMTSYLAIILGQGVQTSGELTQFPYARFIDWSITTPLLLLGLCLLALPRLRESVPLVLGILGADLYMIITGLFAGLSNKNGGAWLVWFVVSSVAFVAIYALLWGPLAKKAKEQAQSGREALKSSDPEERYMGAIHVGESGWFTAMAASLSVLWLAYPVNYFLSEQGINVWGLGVSSAIYTVLDVLAKVVYGFVFLGGVLAIERRAEKEKDKSPDEHMTDTERAQREAEEARREAQTARRELEAARASDGRTRTTAEIEGSNRQPAAEGRYYDVDEETDPVRVRRTPRA